MTIYEHYVTKMNMNELEKTSSFIGVMSEQSWEHYDSAINDYFLILFFRRPVVKQ